MTTTFIKSRRGKGGQFWEFQAEDGARFIIRTRIVGKFASCYHEACSVCIPEKPPETFTEDGITITAMALGTGRVCVHAGFAMDEVARRIKADRLARRAAKRLEAA